jgi:acetyltransferase-like isoleucine patch superfamily enzyme
MRLKRLYAIYRLFILRAAGGKLGDGIKVYGRFTWLGSARNLAIGDATSINEGVFLNAHDSLSIGKHVHLSPYAQLHTGELEAVPGIKRHITAPIVVEDSVWIASGAIITPGVTIGKNSIVGANAVVTSDVPANSIVCGVPARVTRYINEE